MLAPYRHNILFKQNSTKFETLTVILAAAKGLAAGPVNSVLHPRQMHQPAAGTGQRLSCSAPRRTMGQYYVVAVDAAAASAKSVAVAAAAVKAAELAIAYQHGG